MSQRQKTVFIILAEEQIDTCFTTRELALSYCKGQNALSEQAAADGKAKPIYYKWVELSLRRTL